MTLGSDRPQAAFNDDKIGIKKDNVIKKYPSYWSCKQAAGATDTDALPRTRVQFTFYHGQSDKSRRRDDFATRSAVTLTTTEDEDEDASCSITSRSSSASRS